MGTLEVYIKSSKEMVESIGESTDLCGLGEAATPHSLFHWPLPSHPFSNRKTWRYDNKLRTSVNALLTLLPSLLLQGTTS